jgi:sporulation protein YlmC with PRC-barrel domain
LIEFLNPTEPEIWTMTQRIIALIVSLAVFALPMAAFAESPPPTAGKIPLGVTVTEAELIATGWRVSKLVGASIQNDKGEKIGKVDNLIVAPGGTLTIAVIEVGGFLGIGGHLIAIPVRQLKVLDKSPKIVLPGATKEALKQLPEFKYVD